jgi:hypothetical protein
MANLNYRGNGAWGTGLGRPLTSAEIDTNMYQLNTTSQNKMPNSSGELGTYFWTSTDSFSVNNGGVGLYFNVAARASAATVTFTSGNIPVTAGGPFTAAIDALVGSYAGTPLYVDVQYYDNNGTLIQDGANHDFVGINGSTYVTAAFTETVPANATQAQIRLVATNATWSFIRWRRVKVSLTETFNTAFNTDGSLYPLTGQDWSWSNRHVFNGGVNNSVAAGTVSGVSPGRNGTLPDLLWKKVDAPADQKLWDAQQSDTQLTFRAINDAWSTTSNWLTVTRSGATVNAIATTVRPTFNGNTAWDAGNFNPTLYAALASATFTGAVSLSYASPALTLNSAAAGQQRSININTNGSGRWQFGATSGAEGGSNAGSDFFVARYSDAGAFIDSPFIINRATAAASFTGTVTAGNNIQVNGTTADRFVSISANAGQIRGLNFQTAGSARWQISVGNVAEGGSNAGSNLNFARYSDAGAFIENVLSFNRASGSGTVYRPFVVDTNTAAVDSTISLNGAAAKNKVLYLQTNGLSRWSVASDNSAEGGSNAGSNFAITRYSDAGSGVDNPFIINRSTGVATLSKRPVFGIYSPWDNGNLNPFIGAAGGGDESDLAVNVFQSRLVANYTAGANGIVMVFANLHIEIGSAPSGVDVLARISVYDTVSASVVATGFQTVVTLGPWVNGGNTTGSAGNVTPWLATGGLVTGRLYQIRIECMKNQPVGPIYPRTMNLSWFGY